MPLLIVEGIQFNCGVDLFFHGSKAWKSFSLFDVKFVACNFNMLLHFLQAIMQFMIIFFFLVLASNNLVECVLAPQGYVFFFLINNPRIQKV
jgi:hypothetical protein